MRIALLNQFLPPEQPPTARLVGDLAEALRSDGHEVLCLGGAGRYGAVRGARRILRDLSTHARIGWLVLRAGRLDWIVCFSDPTGLPLTARFLAWLKRARLAHWAMDVYPQIAVSLGAVKEGAITRAVAAGMQAGYRGCDLLVALDEDMAAEMARLSGQTVEVLAPWSPEVKGEPIPLDKPGGGRRWVYSGNLGRAHEYKTLLEAQRLLEVRGTDWELHFQGGGPLRTEAEALAAKMGLRRCYWSGYVEDEKLLAALLAADALIATQKPETRGLLWPSKLALMQHLDIPIAWVGPTEGAIAQWLRAQKMPKVLVGPEASAALADWLEALPLRKGPVDTMSASTRVREKVMAERRAGCEWWRQRLKPL